MTLDSHNLPLLPADAEDTNGSCCGGGGCCGGGSTVPVEENTAAEHSTQTFQVNGMTCGHCTRAVTTELRKLHEVIDVRVDPVAGGISTVSVTSTVALEDAQVAAALDEAGDYTLASPTA